MRHTLVLALLLTACSNSHTATTSCADLRCGATEMCCTTCTGLACVTDASLCGCGERPDAGDGDGRCGGAFGDTCSSDEVCNATSCGGTGRCVARPVTCPGLHAPVCGCDDVEYSNECLARSAGSLVAHDGTCDASPVCGDATCVSQEFCLYESGCGADGSPGVCTRPPERCIEPYTPVCGCDGTTYANGCEAHAHLTSIACHGACVGEGDCASQDAHIVSDECDFAAVFWDSSTCVTLTGCCEGTDCGRGYPSEDACAAAHLDCARACGGWSGDTCRDDEFCDFPHDYCDWADGSGVCRPRPDGCPDPGGTPVCGCNGETFLSLCSAQVAGFDAAYDHACDTDDD